MLKILGRVRREIHGRAKIATLKHSPSLGFTRKRNWNLLSRSTKFTSVFREMSFSLGRRKTLRRKTLRRRNIRLNSCARHFSMYRGAPHPQRDSDLCVADDLRPRRSIGNEAARAAESAFPKEKAQQRQNHEKRACLR